MTDYDEDNLTESEKITVKLLNLSLILDKVGDIEPLHRHLLKNIIEMLALLSDRSKPLVDDEDESENEDEDEGE